MITIKRDEALARISPRWRQLAKSATDEVANRRINPPSKAGANPPRLMTVAEAQSAAIAEHQRLWQAAFEVKKLLEDVSHKKCWYCESREVRSSNDIDHFRPKNGVHGELHDGYWWLAFEPSNFRYSCEKCNRPRKGTHFPLAGGTRCKGPKDNIGGEHPMLLDPVVDEDAGLVTFLPDGTVIPRADLAQDDIRFKRASTSIQLYFLLDPDLNEARADRFEYVREQIELGDYLLRRAKQGDNEAEQHFAKVVQRLNKALSDEAEFSSTARAALTLHMTEWIAGLRASGEIK